MRSEVMEFYGLRRSPRAVGFYETAHHRQLLQDIKQAVYDGDLVACQRRAGPAGIWRGWRSRVMAPPVRRRREGRSPDQSRSTGGASR